MQDNTVQKPGFRFWLRSNDDPVKILTMSVLVAFTCAVVVSSTEQLLQPRREANIAASRQAQMSSMLATLPGLESVLASSGVDSLQTRIVDFSTGTYATGIDANTFDVETAQTDPASSIELAPEIDIAGLGRRSNYSPVYLLHKDEELMLVILPVHGVGYQSVIRAWLVLAGDLDTIKAFSIFEQGETPGLGSRIEDPVWQAQFNNRSLRDDSGALRLTVVKGKSQNDFEIDGITGATRTGNGINNLMEFWLGDFGYGPFLSTLAEDSQ